MQLAKLNQGFTGTYSNCPDVGSSSGYMFTYHWMDCILQTWQHVRIEASTCVHLGCHYHKPTRHDHHNKIVWLNKRAPLASASLLLMILGFPFAYLDDTTIDANVHQEIMVQRQKLTINVNLDWHEQGTLQCILGHLQRCHQPKLHNNSWQWSLVLNISRYYRVAQQKFTWRALTCSTRT